MLEMFTWGISITEKFNIQSQSHHFQIPSKSKSINYYETQLKCTLIYGLSINERENPVSLNFYGI